MTCFYLGSTQLNKWMHQNRAEYVGCCVEGCLLDSFVVATKRGFAALYEHYLNPNSSDYYVEFQTGTAQDVFRNWYKFEEKCEYEQKEIETARESYNIVLDTEKEKYAYMNAARGVGAVITNVSGYYDQYYIEIEATPDQVDRLQSWIDAGGLETC